MNPERSCKGPSDYTLSKLILELSDTTAVDFRQYKRGFLKRQIRRQVFNHRLTDSPEYLDRIRGGRYGPKELINHLNIHVTRFFRDPSLFQRLEREIFPSLWERHLERSNRELRIWIIGCSTGEEAYSVAIAFLESLQPDLSLHPVQIFATDLDEIVVEEARKGEFPSGSVAHLAEGLLARYFLRAQDKYRVVPELRRLVTFGTHDLLKDSFIHHLDMIFCRNVLIFLNRQAQDEICEKLYQALDPGGILILGRAESPTRRFHHSGFTTFCRQNRVYEKRDPPPSVEGTAHEEMNT